jgi:predicted phosphodiesterase
MRVFATSDLHVDYEENQKWVVAISRQDFRNDILVVAGDVSDSLDAIAVTLTALADRFRKVLYVPGNHELWVIRDPELKSSSEKLRDVLAVAESCGASTKPFHSQKLSIVPLLGWYDYSFGEPCGDLTAVWMDFRNCRWPQHFGAQEVSSWLSSFNEPLPVVAHKTLISFSHFLPRIDLMPQYIPLHHRYLYPVLGSYALERQLRQLGATLHVYGHSHVNRCVTLDGVSYINNAFGYPSETKIAAKRLVCVYDEERPEPICVDGVAL